ncbi:MAG: hypothetical protein R3F61_36175 [Myxococcota bacterium]
MILLALACTGSTPEAPQAPAPAPVAEPASGTPVTPDGPPFTAEQIRDAMPAGQVVRWRYDIGPNTTTVEWRVRAADATSMTLESRPPGSVDVSTWEALRDHGVFPAASTTLEVGVPLTTGLGDLITRKYVVTDGSEVKTYWFADAYPGPPVQHDVSVDGRRTFHMEQIARERVDPASWEPLPSPPQSE